MSEPSPHDFSPSDPAGSGTEEEALFSLLLQRHRSAMSSRIVLSSIGRTLSVAVAIYVSLSDPLSVVQVVTVGLITYLLCFVWLMESRQLSLQILGLERTMARHSGGETEDLYIESGYYFLRPNIRLLSAYEPAAWMTLITSLLIVSGILNGIGR